MTHEIASNEWCALTVEPVVDQLDQADCAQTWGNNTPTWGWGNVSTTVANWGSANDNEHNPWAPTTPPTLALVSNNVGYTRVAISRLSVELGTAQICLSMCFSSAVMSSLSDLCE